MTNKTWSEEIISNETFKKAITIVDKYIKSGKTISDDRLVYPNYPDTDLSFEYWRYQELKNRWDSYIKINNKEPVGLYISPPAVDISGDDKILPIDTIRDIERRVNKYVSQGGSIESARRIYLDMNTRQEYLTYTKYQDIIDRVNAYRKKNGRDPKFVYIISQSNENLTTRINAVGDDITPNGDGWYFSQRFPQIAKNIKQIYGWDCGPNATQKAYYEPTNLWHDQNQIIKIEGTTTNGTDHNGITRGFTKLAEMDGKKVSVNWSYFSDLGYDKLGKIIKDIKTGELQHCKYKNKYGHYEYIAGVNIKTGKLLVLNSLSGGWLEYRTFARNKSYLDMISQKSICIATFE